VYPAVSITGFDRKTNYDPIWFEYGRDGLILMENNGNDLG